MLPGKTERVWEFLKTQPALGGMVLVGGTALALRINHRISEDLDVACLANELPRARLEKLIEIGNQAGISFVPNESEEAVQEFQQGGMELRDFQQDYLALGVKVSFFTADMPLKSVLANRGESLVRVADLDELFRSKAIVSARRSRTRDWLDIYLLMARHGYTLAHYFEAFHKAGIDSEAEIGLARMCDGTPSRSDEGYQHLLASAPTLAEIKDFFVKARDDFEKEMAEQKVRASRAGRSPHEE